MLLFVSAFVLSDATPFGKGLISAQPLFAILAELWVAIEMRATRLKFQFFWHSVSASGLIRVAVQNRFNYQTVQIFSTRYCFQCSNSGTCLTRTPKVSGPDLELWSDCAMLPDLYM